MVDIAGYAVLGELVLLDAGREDGVSRPDSIKNGDEDAGDADDQVAEVLLCPACRLTSLRQGGEPDSVGATPVRRPALSVGVDEWVEDLFVLLPGPGPGERRAAG